MSSKVNNIENELLIFISDKLDRLIKVFKRENLFTSKNKFKIAGFVVLKGLETIDKNLKLNLIDFV